MQGLRSLKPHLKSPLDREPKKESTSTSSSTMDQNLQNLHNNPDVMAMLHNLQEQMRLLGGQNNRPNPRPMKEYYNLDRYQQRNGLQYPDLEANFELKPTFISLFPTFRGLPNENPYEHIEEFLKICDTLFVNGVSRDAIRLRAFPFSLKEKAHHWLKTIEVNIDDWEILKDIFLKNFFPIGKKNALRHVIEAFYQLPNEHFHDSWDRFKEAIRKCPNHGIPKFRLIQYFYNGINDQARGTLDASCGGYILESDEDQTWKIMENMAEASRSHESHQTFERHNKKAQVSVANEENFALMFAEFYKVKISN